MEDVVVSEFDKEKINGAAGMIYETEGSRLHSSLNVKNEDATPFLSKILCPPQPAA